jgi:CRP-like cAMP-binding protein
MNTDPERLSRVPLFAGLTDDERTRLATWLDIEESDPGTYLTRTGSAGYAFFVLAEGRARVERDGRVLATLEAGDVFGEVAFFDHGRRMADVVAETRVRLLAMFGTRFREMQMSMPDVAERLRQLVIERTEATAK